MENIEPEIRKNLEELVTILRNADPKEFRRYDIKDEGDGCCSLGQWANHKGYNTPDMTAIDIENKCIEDFKIISCYIYGRNDVHATSYEDVADYIEKEFLNF